MARQSIILLNDTNQQVNITGCPVKAAGYYGSGMNLHTIAVYLKNFSGRLYIEGTLASNPCPEDWFPINLNGYVPYAQFPIDPNNPTDQHMSGMLNCGTGDTGVEAYSFEGNFVYIRARIDRTYLPNPDTTNYGSILKILVNY